MAELVDAADSKSAFFGSGGSSPPLGTKKEDRFMRSFFVPSGRDENEVRRSDIRSEDGVTLSVSPKDFERSSSNPISPGQQFNSQVAIHQLLENYPK